MRKAMILTMVVFLGMTVNIWAQDCTGHKVDAAKVTATAAPTAEATAPATATFAGVELDPKKCCPEYQGKCEILCLDIKGMTDPANEEVVAKTLASTDGVIKVMAINQKESAGVVVIDPDKIQAEKVVAAINGLGYESKVLPQAAGVGCKASCAATCLKAGTAKCPSMKTAEAGTEVKTETTTETKEEVKTQ